MKQVFFSVCVLVLASLACLQPASGAVEPTATAEPKNLVQPAELVQEQETPSATPTFRSTLCAVVTASQSLHLRAQASEKSVVVEYLYHDDQVTVLELGGSWWKVETSTGETGYARARYLDETECG